MRGMLEAWGSGGGGAGMGAGRGGFGGGDGFPEGLGVGTDPSSLGEGGGAAPCEVRMVVVGEGGQIATAARALFCARAPCWARTGLAWGAATFPASSQYRRFTIFPRRNSTSALSWPLG